MKSLYLRIWLTVVAALALFALVSGWMWQQHVEQERQRMESASMERLQGLAELLRRSLPGADAPVAEQAAALLDWSQRLRLPLALDDIRDQRIAASDSFIRRVADGVPTAMIKLDDGRTLWLARRGLRRPIDEALGQGAPPVPPGVWPAGGWPPGRQARLGDGAAGAEERQLRRHSASAPERRLSVHAPEPGMLPMPPMLMSGLPPAVGPAALAVVLLLAIAAGAYPVVRRLTRRLEALKQGVETFGAGSLSHRVDASGSDEVAAVAATFNHTAQRIEALVQSHQNLLANASHELRSPLARLKMAVGMYAEVADAARPALRREIDTNVAELDALVEEVLLASRLDANAAIERGESVDLLGLAAEEAARVGAQVDTDGQPPLVLGSERLLRRALRNLLENARRYGGQDVSVQVARLGSGQAMLRVSDRGPGVPAEYRERIFEPFFRLPGHAEREGGVGLGLSLVKQIAQRHGGQVRCEPREGGGSSFVLSMPMLA